MSKYPLHRLVRAGDLAAVRAWLDARPDGGRGDVDIPDARRYTPLMHAAQSPVAGVEVLRLLVERGGDIEAGRRDRSHLHDPLVMAVRAGDPDKVSLLLDAGADAGYRSEGGYNLLLDATFGRDVLRDSRLLELLRLIIAHGAALNQVSGHGESALRVLSRIGRFDAVALLLQAGADESQLAWTPLIRATAIGSLEEVASLIDQGAPLEARDWWERSAWLVAILAGDLGKAQLLRERGADVAARGRCGRPPLHYAVEGGHPQMLRWLLETGQDVEQVNEFHNTALYEAIEEERVECADILLQAGADPSRCWKAESGLRDVRSAAMARLLIDAGDDLAGLSDEARREFLGLPREADVDLLECTQEEFLRGRSPRPGRANPEHMAEPYWQAMIRAGVSAWAANEHFHGPGAFDAGPAWCAQRFGQSLSFLPDGRIVQVGGEHEDGYDPDFCIYNDVFVHHPDGTIDILGYPREIFPPTDFHTATLLGGHLYIIGCLGYRDARGQPETPVYRLDTRSCRIERLVASGESPGWLSRHRAEPVSAVEIRVWGGDVLRREGEAETWTDNSRSFVFDTATLRWRIE